MPSSNHTDLKWLGRSWLLGFHNASNDVRSEEVRDVARKTQKESVSI